MRAAGCRGEDRNPTTDDLRPPKTFREPSARSSAMPGPTGAPPDAALVLGPPKPRYAAGAPTSGRTPPFCPASEPAEILANTDGTEPAAPGCGPTFLWRPGLSENDAEPVDRWGFVARKYNAVRRPWRRLLDSLRRTNHHPRAGPRRTAPRPKWRLCRARSPARESRVHPCLTRLRSTTALSWSRAMSLPMSAGWLSGWHEIWKVSYDRCRCSLL